MQSGLVVDGGYSTTDTKHSWRALAALGVVALVGIVLLAGAGGLVGAASASDHTTIDSCGTTISTNGTYELTGNLTAGAGDCIEINASDVVLDGQGYVITGDGSQHAVNATGGTLSNVTVRNLTAEMVDTGVVFDGVEDGAIESVQVTDASVGVELRDASNVAASDVSVAETGQRGVFVDSSVSVSIADSQVSGAAFAGIHVEDSADLTVLDTTISEVTSVEGPGNGYGLLVEGTDGVTASGLTVENTGVGIGFDDVTGTDLHGSSVTDVGTDGIVVEDSTGVPIAESEDGPATFDGHEPAFPTAVSIHNTTVAGTGLAEGSVTGGAGILVSFSHVDVHDTTVAGADTDGIALVPAVSTLENVTVVGAGGDGIDVTSSAGSTVSIGAGTTITGNTGHGLNVTDGCLEANCQLVVENATIANNGGRDLRAAGPMPIIASNVDVGASTAADTTVDARLSGVSLAGVDSNPGAPGGFEYVDRAVDLQSEAFETGGDGEVEPSEHQSTSRYANLTLQYDEADLGDRDESTIQLARYNGSWQDVEESLDAQNDSVAANFTAYGTVAAVAEPAETDDTGGGGGDFDPGTPDIAVSDASVSPRSVEPGDTVRIDVTLVNEGDADGEHTATLVVDGEQVDSQKVLVRAGKGYTFDFAHTIDAAGEYEFAVDEYPAGSVNAAADTPTATPTDDGDAGGASTQTPTATPTDTPTPTATPTATPTDDGDAGGAPAPDEGDGGLSPLLIVALVAVVAGIVGAGFLLRRE